MIIYNIYIFNRAGVCIYYHEWTRPKQAENVADDNKTVFGLTWTLKTFTAAIDPSSYVKTNFLSL